MNFRRMIASAIVATAAMTATPARAADVIGTVDLLEVWPNGNVAFTLSTPVSSCNIAQFILNESNEGTKNTYALLLAARLSEKQVKVAYTGCGPADGYGGSYHLPLYVYLLD